MPPALLLGRIYLLQMFPELLAVQLVHRERQLLAFPSVCSKSSAFAENVNRMYPAGGSKGRFRIPKINARPERPILQEIKDNDGNLKR
jgi:hypothetical protein